jgi:hypothetical protein
MVVVMARAVWVVMAFRSVLTGRRGRHSTAGLPVVAAAVLPVTNLKPVVRER